MKINNSWIHLALELFAVIEGLLKTIIEPTGVKYLVPIKPLLNFGYLMHSIKSLHKDINPLEDLTSLEHSIEKGYIQNPKPDLNEWSSTACHSFLNFNSFGPRLGTVLHNLVVECVFYQNTQFLKPDKRVCLYLNPLLQRIVNEFRVASPYLMNLYIDWELDKLKAKKNMSPSLIAKFKGRALNSFTRDLLGAVLGCLLSSGYHISLLKQHGKGGTFKTSSVIYLEDLRLEDILLRYAMLSKKPMLIEPKPWVWDNGRLLSGGYILAQSIAMPIFYNTKPDLEVMSSYSKQYCAVINSLQSMPYRINSDLLCTAVALWFKDLTAELQLAIKETADATDTRTHHWARETLNKSISKINSFMLQLSDLSFIEGFVKHINKDWMFYLPIHIDRVGRMYSHGLLNIVNSKFLRAILAPISTSNHIIQSRLVFVDATSSMLQIYACLFGDLNIARLSNLSDDAAHDTVMSLRHSWTFEGVTSTNSVKSLLDERWFIKTVIMLKMYGSGSFGTTNAVYERLTQGSKIKISWLEVQEVVIHVEKHITSTFSILFNIIPLLYNFTGVTLKWQGNKSVYKYKKCKTVCFDISKFYPEKLKLKETLKRKRIGLELIDETSFDKVRTLRTVFTGIFHSIDAAVATRLRHAMKEQHNVIVYSIHDCFACEESNLPLLLKVYKESLFIEAFDKALSDILDLDCPELILLQTLIEEKKKDAAWIKVRNCESPHCLKLE